MESLKEVESQKQMEACVEITRDGSGCPRHAASQGRAGTLAEADLGLSL